MRLVGTDRLDAFQRTHADARGWIAAWREEVLAAQWTCPQDIKDRFPSASIISRGVIVFNVKGNKYRLEVRIAYETGVVSVGRWGTHAEYARWKF